VQLVQVPELAKNPLLQVWHTATSPSQLVQFVLSVHDSQADEINPFVLLHAVQVLASEHAVQLVRDEEQATHAPEFR
jgi:hypothetical protein